MEIHQLRYFAAAAELGSFTRAAETCLVSQPSLSQQIIKLEAELGRPLFDRVARRVVLTDAGRELKPMADRILRLVHEAKARLAADDGAGRLAVAAPPTVAPYIMPELLGRFAGRFPRAEIELIEDVTEVILRRLEDCSADLALLPLPIAGERLHVTKLFSEELWLALPPRHPLVEKSAPALADLAEETFLLLHDAHCLTGNALEYCHSRRFAPLVTRRVSQVATVQKLVALGHGVSLLPVMAARADSSSGCVYRKLAGKGPSRTIGLVHHEDRYHSPLFHAFVEMAHHGGTLFPRTP